MRREGVVQNGVYMIDPELLNTVGHYYNTARSIAQAVTTRGLEFRMVGQQHCDHDLRQALKLTPVLSFRSGKTKRYFGLPPMRGLGFFHFLASCQHINTEFLNPRWVVYIDNSRHGTLLAWSFWLRHFNPACAPVFIFMLRFGYFIPSRKQWKAGTTWMKLALRLLDISSGKYQIQLVSDSEVFAEQFRRITRLDIDVMPIPHTYRILNIQKRVPSSKIHIISIGRASLEKGLFVLTSAIQLLKKMGLDMKFAFKNLLSAISNLCILNNT